MKKILIMAAVIISFTGCSSTRITSSWKSDSIHNLKYNKVLVVGFVKDTDRAALEKMEQHLVGDLKDLGYNAVASMQEYGPKAFDKMEEAQVLDKLKSSGVDAVITIVLLDKEKESRYMPGSIHYSPFGYHQNRFYRYYGTMNTRIYEPGYYVTDTRYFWESNFYTINTETLLYSAQTTSFDPVNAESLGHEYGMTIVNDMVKQNVLAKQ
ncbi:MAG: hypothetical protein IPP72_20035 [Chitinophagaceae bacterium]|nr:hypothetical protein [Chitinophagaceae bacterium]